MTIEIGGKKYEPAFCLAPMEDVTDRAFRMVCKDEGADILYSEFISSEALIRDAVKAFSKLEIENSEHPIGIQLYGSRVDSVLRALRFAEKAGPDFIDLNAGCPAEKVARQGMGSGLLKNLPLFGTIVREMVRASSLPVTVKIRLGWDEHTINIMDSVKILAENGVKWVAVHARTRAQAYGGKADWSYIKKVKEEFDLPVIGNGDINSVEDAEKALTYSGCDGIMIGRGAVKKPWLFRMLKSYFTEGKMIPEPEFEEKVLLARKHVAFLRKYKDDRMVCRSFMRFSRTYFGGVPGVAKIRQRLSHCRTGEELEEILNDII